jgi:hypothetical protein
MDWMLALPSNGTSLFGICVSGGRSHVSTMFRWVFEGYFSVMVFSRERFQARSMHFARV